MERPFRTAGAGFDFGGENGIDWNRHARLCANLSFFFRDSWLPRLNCGSFHARGPSPSVMSKPNAKILAAAEANMSTNRPREQPLQQFTGDAIERAYASGHFEVHGQ